MQAIQTHKREDGSEVQIVATAFFGAGLTKSVGTYVLSRKCPDQPWQLASDRPHPNWRQMSVQEYVQHGRPEMLQLASPIEILKVISLLETAVAEEEIETDDSAEVESASTRAADVPR